ncbi:F-box/FBD/LRR-repeat protein [Corchorus capsularis]|uniref:F-box/FBD/LRR-repeat protein n=1 Tax=Corchorus capsularis TaxID=210143 RepID=A0A1R3JFU0_COCAP|nr:F-box/FBD/LRR-repeat protein [Corchorus capsularis]
MDRLMLFLSSKNVQQLEFHVDTEYKLPQPLFSCVHLTILELQCCIFNPPPTFTGFGKLVCVDFIQLQFSSNRDIENFISKCPLLEELTLENCINTDQLEIDAPNLKFYYFTGELISISFKNAPLLKFVSIGGGESNIDQLSTVETSNLINTFISLPAIEQLGIGWKFLCFRKEGDYYKENRIDPVLHFLEDQDSYRLHQLREVRLGSVYGTRYIFDLVRFLLARSLTLKKMVIQPMKGILATENLKFVKEKSFEKQRTVVGKANWCMMKKQDCSSNSDIISTLPTEIIENILSFLPLKDAMETRNGVSKDILAAIFQILSVHRGKLLKLTLSIPTLKDCPEMDRLILSLSNKNCEELEFCFSQGFNYKLPTSLFSCVHLSILKLQCCIFNPPPTFTGFHKLVCVEFHNVEFAADHTIESFISKCPLLEQLTLEDCSNTKQLEVDAPNLKFFSFSGPLVSINFKNTLVLATVSFNGEKAVDFNGGPNIGLSTVETSNLVNTFICLPAIVHLVIGWNFLSYLIAGIIPERLPITLECLEVLEIDNICSEIPNEVNVALCLIRSSPNLRKLKLQFYTEGDYQVDGMDPVMHLLEDQDSLHDCLHRLQEVELTNYLNGTRYFFYLARFLFARSLTLKKMVIQPRKGIDAVENLNVLKEVARFKRVSPYAELVYLDPDEKLV